MLRKKQASDFQIGQGLSANGRVFNCKSGKENFVVKEYILGKKSVKEVIDECSSWRIKQDGLLGTFLPEFYYEDGGRLFFIYKKFNKSLQEVIQDHKRKGEYISMSDMKNYVSEFADKLRKIHSKENFQHCRIKPSNLFLSRDEEGDPDYIITDFLPFSNENLEEYLSPEHLQGIKRNNSQRFVTSQLQIQDLVGGDPKQLDLWQLGITFLELATLKTAKELLIFREPNLSVQAIEIKELCRQLYGNFFVQLIDALLKPKERKMISQLSRLLEDFQTDNDINHAGIQMKPDTTMVLSLLDQKAKQLDKNSNLQQYLQKYEMIQSKIKVSQFYEAAENLGVELELKEKQALEAEFDKSKTGELDFSQLFQVKKGTIKMGALSLKEQESLQDLLIDMHNFMDSSKLNPFEKFREKDVNNQGHLIDKVFFQLFADLKMKIPEEDEVLVSKKYDPEKKKVIYYVEFFDDLNQLNSAKESLEGIKVQIYKNIRDKENNFKQFFRSYDSGRKGYLSFDDLQKFLGECKIFMQQKVSVAFFQELNTKEKNKILYSDIRMMFQKQIDEEVKQFLTQITASLQDIGMNFMQMIRQHTNSRSVITKQQLYQGLKEMSVQMSMQDLNYVLSCFDKEGQDEILYVELAPAIHQMAKKLNVPKSELFAEATQTIKLDDSPELSTINKSVMFNARAFDSQKSLLSAIFTQIEARETTPQLYFKAPGSRMTRQDYKKRIRDLDIRENDYETEQEDLLHNIKVPTDPLMVDVDQLIEACLYYKVRTIEKVRMNEVFQFACKLNQQMKANSFTFEEFKEMDTIGDGTIRRKLFEGRLTQELQLPITDTKYKPFIKYISESETNISVQKLRTVLQQEQLAQKMLLDLNDEIAFNKNKPEQVFRKYDNNKNTKLELREFQDFIDQLLDKPNPKVVEALFHKFDTNGDLTISLVEFRAQITGAPDKLVVQRGKYQYKGIPVVKKISEQLMRSALKLQVSLEVQSEDISVFDQKKRGKVSKIFFEETLADYKLDVSEFKGLIDYITIEDDDKYLSMELLQDLLKAAEEQIIEAPKQELSKFNRDQRSQRKPDNRQQNDDPLVKFEPQKILLQEICRVLEEMETTPQQYFKSPGGRMTRQDYKTKIRALNIKFSEYEWDDLLQNIWVKNDPTMVDVGQLVEACLYYKVRNVDKVRMNEVYWFAAKLNQSMKEQAFTFNEFKELDTANDGTIKRKLFEARLTQHLQLPLTDAQYRPFIKFISENETNISVLKLITVLEEEQLASKMLLDLNDEIDYNKDKPEQVFRQFDKNKNTKLDIREFYDLICQLLTNPDQKIVDVLFYKFDTNCDQSISLAEFRAQITGSKEDKYLEKNRPPVKKLNEQILRAAQKLSESLTHSFQDISIFDQKRRGIFLRKLFEDKLFEYKLDISEFRGLMQYITSEEDEKYLSTKLLSDLLKKAEQSGEESSQKQVSFKNDRDLRAPMNADLRQSYDPLQKFESQKQLIQEISRQIEERKTNPQYYFQSPGNRMTRQDYKNRIRGLNIKANDYEDEQEDLLQNIRIQNDPTMVDVTQLIDACLFYRGSSNQVRLNEVFQFAAKLNNQMRNYGFPIEEFQRMDTGNGTIRSKLFEGRLIQQLQLPLNDSQYRSFTQLVSEIDTNISIYKLTTILQQEQLASRMLFDLNTQMAHSRADADQVFRQYDNNWNVKLELPEFQILMQQLLNRPDPKIVEALFHKFDINGDLAISIDEFRSQIFAPPNQALFTPGPPQQFQQRDPLPYQQREQIPNLLNDQIPYPQREQNPYPQREQFANQQQAPYLREQNPYPQREQAPYPQREQNPYPQREQFPNQQREQAPYPQREQNPYPQREQAPYPQRDPQQQRDPIPQQFPQSKHIREPSISMRLDYNRQYYEDLLKTQCTKLNLDLFDVFVQYDRTELPELKIMNVPDLEKAFEFLELQAPTQHVSQFYIDYSRGSQFSIVEIYLRMANAGKLTAKALHMAILRHNYTPDFLFQAIGQKQPQPLIGPFIGVINTNLQLELGQEELQEAVDFWDPNRTGKINFKRFVEVLQLNQVQTKLNKNPPIKHEGEQIYKDFMEHLSKIVNSKACFNLYEKIDVKKYNTISLNDFEKVTRQLISDVKTEEIVAISQYLCKDGLINLDNLAKALSVDRNRQQNFSLEAEKEQFGLQTKGNIKQPAQNVQSIQEKFKKIIPLITDALKKKQKTAEDLAYYYFPVNGQSTMDKPTFCRKTVDYKMGLTNQQCEDFYDYLDANNSGAISINEFRLVFQIKKSDQSKKAAENIVMAKEIEDEIRDLFKEIDINNSNTLDQTELHKALCKVGLNPSVDELQAYFREFDKDQNGTISYDEFSIIVKDILRKELLQADDLLEEIRKEFRLVCNPATRMLSKDQVQQVFKNLGVHIKDQELDDLFEEIDEDKSGAVDIDEFVYFIQKNQSGMSAKASVAVMNIKGSRRISLNDLKEIFQALPNNFIISFIRNQNKKLLNLPSSTLKPQLDSCGLFYTGIQYIEANQLNIKASIIEKVKVQNVLALDLRLVEATGVPIPPQDQAQGQNQTDSREKKLYKREVGIILLDKSRNRLEGNAIYVPASWKPEMEDKWLFELPNMEHNIILRWANFDEKIDTNIELVFEFITYQYTKGKLVQIGCCYGSIPLSYLKSGKVFVDLKGGTPMKELVIAKEDVRANRTGWRSVVQALSSNVKSQLLIEIGKLTPQYLQKVSALPPRTLVNKWALPMQSAFREYFAFRTMMRGEIDLNLASDIRIKAWLNCIDCPDTYKPIAQLWTQIEQKSQDHQFILKSVQTIADSLYLMFKNADFKFNQGDPSNRIDYDTLLVKKRMECIENAIQEIKSALGLLPPNTASVKKVIVSNMEPLNIEEMMDLDSEADIAAMEKFLSRKKLVK